MFGRPGVCYESAQTRKYQLGRTEVIRSASSESKEWAEAMLDAKPQVSFMTRHQLYPRPFLPFLFQKGMFSVRSWQPCPVAFHIFTPNRLWRCTGYYGSGAGTFAYHWLRFRHHYVLQPWRSPVIR